MGRPTYDTPLGAARPDQLPADVATPDVEEAERRRTRSAERGRMRKSALGYSLLTLVSRVFGFAREIVSSALFGVSTTMSAFTIAFQIPNLIKEFVAETALRSSMVPVFTELKEQGETDRAWRVAGTILTLLLLVLGPITILSMVAAPTIVDLIVADHFPGFELAVDLFRIMVPIVVLMTMSGVIVAILNCYDHFAVPALAPIAWNVVVIGALLGLSPLVAEDQRIYLYAGGVLVGTLVQLLLPVPWLRGRGGQLRLATALRDPAVKTVIALMLPITLSLVLVNANILVNTYFSMRVPDELLPHGSGPAVIQKAFKVFLLPQGIFAIAVSTVFFPALARYIARQDLRNFRATFSDGLRQLFVVLLPMSALMMALSEPMVRLLYQRGDFTASDTPLVAGALAGFGPGLVFSGAALFMIRACFSLRLSWMPSIAGAVMLVANVIFVSYLHQQHGALGIGVATSLSFATGFTALYVVLLRRLGNLHSRRNATTFLLASTTSAATGWAAWMVWSTLDAGLGRSGLAQVVSLGTAIAASGIVYLAIVMKLGLVSRQAMAVLMRRNRKDGAAGDDGAGETPTP